MNLNFRIKIYIAVAIFLAITYIFKNINDGEPLPVIDIFENICDS